MTSFAFILGILPLVVASGAGAASRHALGTAVFGGMLAATIMGVFAVPTFYSVIQGLLERFRKSPNSSKRGRKCKPYAYTLPIPLFGEQAACSPIATTNSPA